MIILALLVVLLFSISSISAQSVNNSDDLDKKILKSNSSSYKSTTSIATKAKTNSIKKTSANKAITNKTSTSKTKANATTVNKKTLAKTSTSFINYVEKNGKFPKVKIRCACSCLECSPWCSHPLFHQNLNHHFWLINDKSHEL